MATAAKLDLWKKEQTQSRAENELQRGSVITCSTVDFQVKTTVSVLTCRRAAGCLLQPCMGDLVLIHDGEPAYILSVLERDEEMEAILELPAQTTFSSRDKLTLEAGQLRAAARDRLDLSAQQLSVTASTSNWLVNRLSFVGEVFNSSWQQAEHTVIDLQTHCCNWTQRLVNSFRHIRELDETQAQDVRIVAEETLNTHARLVNQTATELVRIDSEEVHLG